MRTYEVELSKPRFMNEWCLWDEAMVSKLSPTTTAVLTASNETILKAKLDRLYPGVKVLSFKQIR